jgi:hypothetical protein
MVPTMRLELTRLAPLPPQDSVSTNFTTSALLQSGHNTRNSGPGFKTRIVTCLSGLFNAQKNVLKGTFYNYFGTSWPGAGAPETGAGADAPSGVEAGAAPETGSVAAVPNKPAEAFGL